MMYIMIKKYNNTTILLLYPLFSIIFFLIFQIKLLFSLLSHYYSSIVLIIFPIIFDYFRFLLRHSNSLHPNHLQELADTNSCPMR